MENKKNLKVNCAACDVRGITEELLLSLIHISEPTRL